MKKKLLITGSTFPRYENDTEPRFILDYAKAMKKYADVTVMVPAAIGAKDREELEGVKVIRYHYFPIHKLETLCYPGAIVPRIREKKSRILLVPFLFLSLFINLKRRQKKYDMVSANWLIPQGIVSSFVNIPYVVTGHGGDVTSLNKGILRKLKIRCLKKAYGVTAVSQPLMNVLNDMYKAPHTDIISMGCNTELFGSENAVENYFNQNGLKVILFVGRLAEKKGVEYAIEAMKYIDNAMLVIAGDGPLRKELKEKAENICSDYDKKIVFIGPKTHKELIKIYASSDVFIMPSVTAKDGDKEGFGLVMLEAFASGLPIVASASGGITDLVEDGVNGLLTKERDSVGIADNINRLLNDDELYKHLKSNAVITAKKYDYAVIAKKYAEFMGLTSCEETAE